MPYALGRVRWLWVWEYEETGRQIAETLRKGETVKIVFSHFSQESADRKHMIRMLK